MKHQDHTVCMFSFFQRHKTMSNYVLLNNYVSFLPKRMRIDRHTEPKRTYTYIHYNMYVTYNLYIERTTAGLL